MPKPKKEPSLSFANSNEKENAIKAAVDAEERAQSTFEVAQLRYALAQAHNALSTLQMEVYGPQIQQAASSVKAAEDSKKRTLAAKVCKQEK